MRIESIVWLQDVVEKLAEKHHVATHEVEEVFKDKPKFRLVERGKRKGEEVYLALGQTASGRYLSVIFIYKKKTKEALILSARDMVRKERRHYGKGQ